MIKLGLTGSIGMGKSTTAKMFAARGCAVWDADAAVHRLYSEGGAAVIPISLEFPQAMVAGVVSRDALRSIISTDSTALGRIEKIVHPLVALDRQSFIDKADAEILVFDIPLLFETRGNMAMDAVACVSVSPEEQEARVMARGTMTRDQFLGILAKQMPNTEKCAKSDYIIDTSTLESAAQDVDKVINDLKKRMTANA